jgi:uncharacterized RDD family membrane protein YckC
VEINEGEFMHCTNCGHPNDEGEKFCASCGALLKLPQNAGILQSQPVASPPPPVQVIHETPPTEPEMAPTHDVAYAGFWRRSFALLLDTILVSVVLVAAMMLTLVVVIATVGQDDMYTIPAVSVVSLLVSILWFPVLECGSWQASPGKRIMKIYVTDREGQRISFWRSVGRTLLKFISSITVMIGYFMAGFTDKKQALHDKMTGCLVVRGRPGK